MKVLITAFLILYLQSATAQNRELIYANSRNTVSLYHYTDDKEFNYVLFYKNADGVDALGYEYLNFKSLSDLNLFLQTAIRAITERKYIQMRMNNKDLYVYGTSKQTSVIYTDDKRGLLNKADATELKTKIAGL